MTKGNFTFNTDVHGGLMIPTKSVAFRKQMTTGVKNRCK